MANPIVPKYAPVAVEPKEEGAEAIKKERLCGACYLLPRNEDLLFNSLACRCIKVLSVESVSISIESEKGLDELFTQLKRVKTVLDLTLLLPYNAVSLDSKLLVGLRTVLAESTSIVALHLHFRYIYNEHKIGEEQWGSIVKEFAASLEKNQSLATLDLTHTPLGGLANFAFLLEINEALRSLNLRNGGLDDREGSVLLQALCKNRGLKALNLSGNYIRFLPLVTLCERNKVLEEVDLSENLLSQEGILELMRAVEISQSLKSLTLAKSKLAPSNVTGIGKAGIEALGMLLGKNPLLEYLNISGNNIDAGGAKYIAGGLKRNSHLKFLDLSQNGGIGDDGGTALAEALQTNSTLLSLNLSHTGLGDQTVVALSKVLERQPTLQVLHLAGNSGDSSFSGVVDTNAFISYKRTRGLGTSGAQALARAVEKNRSLQLLDLGGCSVDTEGMWAIAKAMMVNKSLKSLIVTSNGINNAVAKALAEALMKGCPLKSLDVCSCWIGDEGLVAFAEALRFNDSLVSLDLRRNYFGTLGLMALSSSLEVNVTLRSLYLGGNFEEEAIKTLLQALAKNFFWSQKLHNFDLQWSTVYSSWHETRWDSHLACLQGFWSYAINGSTIATADSFGALFEEIRRSEITPDELIWLHEIPVPIPSPSPIKHNIESILSIGTQVLSSSPPMPRGKERSASSVGSAGCAIL